MLWILYDLTLIYPINIKSMHENSGIQFLGELSHNKMKSLGKFNFEAKLKGVPNELRLMNSYGNVIIVRYISI